MAAQWSEALMKANEIRRANAGLCKLIKESGSVHGRFVAATTLEGLEDESAAGSLPIRRLLLAIPSFGEKRAGRYLRAAGVFTGDRKMRELSDRQRAQLVALLRLGSGLGVGVSLEDAS